MPWFALIDLSPQRARQKLKKLKKLKAKKAKKAKSLAALRTCPGNKSKLNLMKIRTTRPLRANLGMMNPNLGGNEPQKQ